ncbi:hypothetical protein H634G_03458 [Metarhizium anisopliae BRIP 53293]|uniref:Uncharacterized protein n=1 Tax=Metarhizium anisopliae BRIP 53293 TaxID=1291518 RepID=A0A0D9P7X6_METAN|nr:hypothetical protein H634G_03458 [Metarhizium anisopliae BRIP 53293]KJK92063.1 hypothetical protein H633G_04099 [Metarhizium anisopliae BRIP 53284]
MSAIRLLSYGLRNMVVDSKDDSKNKVLIEADTKNENLHWDCEQGTPHTSRIGGRRFQGGLNNLRQVAIRYRDAQNDSRNKKVSIQSCQLTALLPDRRHQNMFSLAESLTRVTVELYGRSAIQKWKCTQGKAKPWRRNTFLGHGGEIKGIPASFLRRYARFGSSYLDQCKRNCKRRRFELELEYEAHRELDDVTGKLCDLDAENESWEWKPEDVKYLLTERVDASLESSQIPYEAYVGSILGEQFQLGRLISEGEHWGEAVYQVTALLAPNKALEARSYCLSGLPREQLASIKRRMKRLHRKYGVSKIDQARKKFLVYYRNSPSNTPGGERKSERRLGASTSTKDRMTFRISNYDYEFPALLETKSPQHTRMGVWTKERSWAVPDQSLMCEESINESSARDNHAAEEPKPPSSGQNPVVSSNILDSCAPRSPLRRRRRPRKSKAKVAKMLHAFRHNMTRASKSWAVSQLCTSN